jgi:hypothetical protein
MEKNSRVEVGKTPAEDMPGKKTRVIKDGQPLYNSNSINTNCISKVASLLDLEQTSGTVKKDKPDTTISNE